MPRDARPYLADIIESCDAITLAVQGLEQSPTGANEARCALTARPPTYRRSLRRRAGLMSGQVAVRGDVRYFSLIA